MLVRLGTSTTAVFGQGRILNVQRRLLHMYHPHLCVWCPDNAARAVGPDHRSPLTLWRFKRHRTRATHPPDRQRQMLLRSGVPEPRSTCPFRASEVCTRY